MHFKHVLGYAVAIIEFSAQNYVGAYRREFLGVPGARNQGMSGQNFEFCARGRDKIQPKNAKFSQTTPKSGQKAPKSCQKTVIFAKKQGFSGSGPRIGFLTPPLGTLSGGGTVDPQTTNIYGSIAGGQLRHKCDRIVFRFKVVLDCRQTTRHHYICVCFHVLHASQTASCSFVVS